MNESRLMSMVQIGDNVKDDGFLSCYIRRSTEVDRQEDYVDNTKFFFEDSDDTNYKIKDYE